jgi:hypothetical protein
MRKLSAFIVLCLALTPLLAFGEGVGDYVPVPRGSIAPPFATAAVIAGPIAVALLFFRARATTPYTWPRALAKLCFYMAAVFLSFEFFVFGSAVVNGIH